MSSSRPCSHDQKVDNNKYVLGYLRIWGVKCTSCNGTGIVDSNPCPSCKGIGFIEKPVEGDNHGRRSEGGVV